MFLLLLLGWAGLAPLGAAGPVNKTLLGSLAVKGYDVVAYFTEGEPRKGRAEFEVEHEGATYRFATAEHRDRFRAEPARYLPAYGGYCAWAVSQNYTAPIDPTAWKIVEGRLFLNYSAAVQARWEADRDALIEAADRNWPALHD